MAAVSFALSLGLTPLVRNVFVSFGVVDRPGDARRVHKIPRPRVGGIAIVVSYAASYLLVLVLPSDAAQYLLDHQTVIWRVLPAATVVFLVGLIDDVVSLRPFWKLAGQVAASLWAWIAGVRVLAIVGVHLSPAASCLVTIAWLVACANAFNLIDGIDGLATGAGLFATLTTFLAAIMAGRYALALATLPLAGALLGFLRYNFNPASVFLGDCGSLLIGFLLGCYGVTWSQKSATILGMTAPMIALALPLLDVFLSIARRWLRNKPIFDADRGHIHHRLLDQGLTPRRTALILYGVCGVAAVTSLIGSMAPARAAAVALVAFAGFIWVAVQKLDYVEFGVFGRMLRNHAFQNMLDAQVRTSALEKSVNEAASPDECWEKIREACANMGVRAIRGQLADRMFISPVRPLESDCRLDLHLREGDFVQLHHPPLPPESAMRLGLLASALHRSLRGKLDEFRYKENSLHPELSASRHGDDLLNLLENVTTTARSSVSGKRIPA